MSLRFRSSAKRICRRVVYCAPIVIAANKAFDVFPDAGFKGCLEVCAFREQTAAECNGQRWNGAFWICFEREHTLELFGFKL